MACSLCSVWVIPLVYLIYKLLDWLIRIPRLMGLNKRYILITGCDTGFGHATAKKLDALGCHVFAACLTEKGEDELKKSCSDRLKTVHLDVSNHDSVLKAFDYVKDNIPDGMGLWALLNNAGISGVFGLTDWCYLKDYEQVMSVNLYGLIDVSTVFLPLVKKARGRIISTASVFGRFAFPGCTPYTVSKFGVEAFSDCLRRDMKVFGVSAHLIEPGLHRTNITDTNRIVNSIQSTYDRAPQEAKEAYGEEFVRMGKKSYADNFGPSGVFTTDISGVVNAYTHAAIGWYPRARYVVGKDAKLIWLPLQWMPEWMGDWLMEVARKHQGAIDPARAVK